jgi:hypothetical protein
LGFFLHAGERSIAHAVLDDHLQSSAFLGFFDFWGVHMGRPMVVVSARADQDGTANRRRSQSEF